MEKNRFQAVSGKKVGKHTKKKVIKLLVLREERLCS